MLVSTQNWVWLPSLGGWYVSGTHKTKRGYPRLEGWCVSGTHRTRSGYPRVQVGTLVVSSGFFAFYYLDYKAQANCKI